MERTRFLEDTSLQFIKRERKKAIKTIKVTGNANAKIAENAKEKRNILYQNLKAYKENKWNV